MKRIVPSERCAHCGQQLGDDVAFRFPHFAPRADDKLVDYSGRAIHAACLLDWPDAPEFLDRLAEHIRMLATLGTQIAEARLAADA